MKTSPETAHDNISARAQTAQLTQSINALRLAQVLDKTGLSRSHIYRLVEAGKFPKPTHLSERISAWKESDVDGWLAEKFGGHSK